MHPAPAACIGEYDKDASLNLGQNRWYGRVGGPIVWQLGPWVPGRRITLKLLPSIWQYGATDDFNGTILETDSMYQVEGHLDRDFDSELMALEVDVGALISAGTARPLFRIPTPIRFDELVSGNYYEVSSDGSRFLLRLRSDAMPDRMIRVTTNWPAAQGSSGRP